MFFSARIPKPVCIALDGLLFFLSNFFLCAIFRFAFLSLCLYRSAAALCVFLLYDFISGLLWCFECFDLLIYHVVRCTAFIYINRCMGFLLLQIKLFAFQSVTLKVYRPYVLVCFQTSVATFNLILTPLHLRLRRRISSQKWMNKLEFFLQKTAHWMDSRHVMPIKKKLKLPWK